MQVLLLPLDRSYGINGSGKKAPRKARRTQHTKCSLKGLGAKTTKHSKIEKRLFYCLVLKRILIWGVFSVANIYHHSIFQLVLLRKEQALWQSHSTVNPGNNHLVPEVLGLLLFWFVSLFCFVLLVFENFIRYSISMFNDVDMWKRVKFSSKLLNAASKHRNGTRKHRAISIVFA